MVLPATGHPAGEPFRVCLLPRRLRARVHLDPPAGVFEELRASRPSLHYLSLEEHPEHLTVIRLRL